MKPETPTMTENTSGILNMTLPAICDICERPRNQGRHAKCSKVRQALYAKRRTTK